MSVNCNTILQLFKQEGAKYWKLIKEAREEVKNSQKNKTQTGNADKKDKAGRKDKTSGLYPILAGCVNFTSDFNMVDPMSGANADHKEKSDSKENENTIQEEHSKTPERGKAAGRKSWPATPSQGPSQPPRYCSTERKDSRVLDCFAKHSDRAGGSSYWLDLDHEGIDLRREIDRSVIHELEKEIEQEHEKITSEEGEPKPKHKTVKADFGLRNRPNLRKPDWYVAGMNPILIKGEEGHYVPWQMLDLAGLVSRLPDVHEGANKWIRAFEEATVGKMLALGDIKSIWAQCFGVQAMESIMKSSDQEWMLLPRADGTAFDVYRPALWKALREEYPTRVDPRMLKGDPLSETENPATYITRQMKKWKQETEEEIEKSPALTTLFRNTIVEALPTSVRSRLDDVVGLSSMPHQQFRDHVVHAVDRYRQDEQRMMEQDKTVQRKLAQLQLGELQGKTKAKTQAAVVKTAEPPAPNMMVSQPSQGLGQPSIPQITAPPTQSPPVVNVYQQPNTLPRAQYAGRGRGTFQRGGFGNGELRRCWNCGDCGHFAAQCSRAPANGGGRRGRGQYRPRDSMGLVNPWVGPNHGY